MNISIISKFNRAYPILKLKEVRHRINYPKHDKYMAIAMERYINCKNKKPDKQIKREMELCRDFWGCYPLHYIRYELFKEDKVLSDEELIDYIPEYYFYRLFLPAFDSGENMNILSEKALAEKIFRGLNIAQPLTLAKLIYGHLFSREMDSLTFDALIKELEAIKPEKIFIKPVDGEGGANIHTFHRQTDGYYAKCKNEQFDIAFLNRISKTGNYILQAGIVQHPELSKIYPYSVNTLRITTRNVNGKVHIPCAVLRMGRSGCEVDNSCQGGLFSKIDMNSGTLETKAFTHFLEVFLQHPDTGFAFKGYKIPFWDEVIQFAKTSARKLHYFTFLGWDIALTEKGPLAIESNLYFGLDIYQIAMGGLRKIFEIENPSVFWKGMNLRSK